MSRKNIFGWECPPINWGQDRQPQRKTPTSYPPSATLCVEMPDFAPPILSIEYLRFNILMEV